MPGTVDPKADRDRETYQTNADYEPTPVGDPRSGWGSPEHLDNLREKLIRLKASQAAGIPIPDDEVNRTEAQIYEIRERLYGKSNPDSSGHD